MDADLCMKKLEYVGVLAFATTDKYGNPQIRNISAIYYEPDAMYFFTAKGKSFCEELLADGRVQVLGYTKYKEMIRLSSKAVPADDDKQKKYIDLIFEKYPYLGNLYPGDTRYMAGIVFRISDAMIEYFNLGVNPIFRESYTIGNGSLVFKGFTITDKCISCGVCAEKCPQKCIESGTPYSINQKHCLHCGICKDICPHGAVVKME